MQLENKNLQRGVKKTFGKCDSVLAEKGVNGAENDFFSKEKRVKIH